MLYSGTRPPAYQATAKVFIGPQEVAKGNLSSAVEALTASRDFIASYAQLLRGRPLVEHVVERLQLPIAPSILVREISTTIVPGTRLISVTVTDGDPKRVAAITNTLVEAFISDVQSEFGAGSGVKATVVEPAIPPTGRSSPAPVRDGVLGAILGLMLGAGGALLLESLDTRIRSKEDVERALSPLPLLVSIPLLTADESKNPHFLVGPDTTGHVGEAFRILRTNVQFLSVDRPLRRVLVTGAREGDGKTTVASNLAGSLAIAGYTTLLLETDLRRPSIHEILGQPPTPGLAEVLLGRTPVQAAVRRTHIPNLWALPSGVLPPNPSELLGSQRMVEILDQFSEMYDVVVLDTPPTMPVTDALVLAPRVDGIIFVVRSGVTHRDSAKTIVEQFERIGARVLGVVLNAAKAAESGYGYGYGYTYSYDRDGRESSGGNGSSRERGQKALPQSERAADANGSGPIVPVDTSAALHRPSISHSEQRSRE